MRLFGLQNEANVFGDLVADVGQQRQLARRQELGDLLDEAGLLHLIGNFGDDDLPGAAARILRRPAGAHPEAAPAGLVGFEDRGAGHR